MSRMINSAWGSVRTYLPYWMAPRTNLEILHDRFGDTPEVNEILQKCFSSHANGLLPLDKEIFNKIGQILERKKIGVAIADEWKRIILDDKGSLENTHLRIPNTDLLEMALKAQLAFDRELLILKKMDRVQRFNHKVIAELNVLKRKLAPPKGNSFTESEQRLLDQLEEKGKVFGRGLNEQIERSIQSREDLLIELQDQIGLLKFELRKQTSSEREAQDLLRLSKMEDPPRTLHYDHLNPALENHYVIACGDPILDEHAKFIIVKRAENMPDAAWEKFISSQEAANLFDILKSKPNESSPITYQTDDRAWEIEICYETAKEAIGLHEDRDFKMKTRRLVLEPGKRYMRINSNEQEGICQQIKNMWRNGIHSDWSEHRESTAAADCHEAILVNRTLIAHILYGRADLLTFNKFQHLGEYFDSLPNNYTASLQGSYLQDPRFLQAQSIHNTIFREMTAHRYEEDTISPILENAATVKYSAAKDLLRVRQIVENLFELYDGWANKLEAFHDEMKKFKNRRAAEVIGQDLLDQIASFIVALRNFVENAPPQPIKELLKDRVRSLLTHKYLEAELSKERDAIQKSLHDSPQLLQNELAEQNRMGKEYLDASKEKLANQFVEWQKKYRDAVDMILKDTLLRIDVALAPLTAMLVGLNVPFSSRKMQEEITQALLPEVLPLYQNSIPLLFINKAKIKNVVQDVMEGTETSVLMAKEVEFMASADKFLVKGELQRSRFAKLYLGNKR